MRKILFTIAFLLSLSGTAFAQNPGNQSIPAGGGGGGTISGQTTGCYLLASSATASTSSGSVCDNGTTVSTSKALTAGAGTFTSIPSPGAIGGTTPAAITGTTITANTSLTINGGTAQTGTQGTDTKLLTAGTISGTGATLCTDANAGATTSGCSGGGSVSITASSPIVVTPSPLTGTGVVSCPTCNTSSATISQYGGAFGTPGGTPLSTGLVTYFVIPRACTINGWNVLADTGTATVKFWKIATGTAIPTVANVINTSGVSLASGTAVNSTTVTDFTTTTVAANDIGAVTLTAVSGAGYVQGTFTCQ